MSNLKNYFIFIFKSSRFLIPLMIVQIILKSLIMIISTYLASSIIDMSISGEYEMKNVILIALMIIILLFLLSFFSRIISYLLNRENIVVKEKFDIYISELCINLNYELKENPLLNEKKQKSLIALDRAGGIDSIANGIIDITSSVISIIGMVAIISSLKWYLFVVLLFAMLINYFIRIKINEVNYSLWDNLIPINRGLSYYNGLATKSHSAKCIRIYNMPNYIKKKFHNGNKESLKYIFKNDLSVELLNCLNLLVDFVVLGIVYSILVVNVKNNIIAIGSFVLFVNSINQFKNCFNIIFDTFTDFKYSLKYLNNFFDFSSEHSIYLKKELIDNFKFLKLVNVSFSYPNSDVPVLKNINLIIRKNERIAIVGKNGSGKTTLIKIIMGLYKSYSGKITINNIDINNIKTNDIYAPVFQDFKFFSGTIKENLDCYSEIKINNVFKSLNFDIKKLNDENPYETILYREFEKNGIELSVGENQKLALCRAKLKDVCFLVLDEPTASLDAKQESYLYEQFDEISKDKTIIYISHRMSVCKLVDRIIVIDNGVIVEDGSHNDLMNKKGMYYDMFNSQLKLYE